jgi:hypothetical protein
VYWACGLAIDEEASDFCFGCGRHDVGHYLANHMDGSVEGWVVRSVPEEEVSAYS